MLELSLHILDLMENAVRAGATVVRVTVAEDPARDSLEMVVEDNGPGLPVPPERAADPFFTTGNKRVGLGLSLFREAAEDADGSFRVEASELGGTAVRATMRLSHVDRKPLGDLPGTLLAVACTHPEVDVRCRLCWPGGSEEFSSVSSDGDTIAEALAFAEAVHNAMGHLSC